MSQPITKKTFQTLLGCKILAVREIPGGFNSVVYKIIDEENKTYIAKIYIRYPNDSFDRLEIEYGALDFLWKNGIRSVPAPIAKSASAGVGIYRFIDGKRLRKGSYTTADIGEIIRFWRSIHELSKRPSAKALPKAKEACLSIAVGLTDVQKRLKELLRIGVPFVDTELSPLFRRIEERIGNIAGEAHIDEDSILPRHYQTLSPSDFGFHNAIRDHRGNIVFIDFEYFGWDDPAKMIADFFLHPKMNYPYKLRPYFFNRISQDLSDDKTLSKRLAIMYLLQSMRWCLIMLNIFRYSSVTRKDKRLAAIQLAKAKTFAGKIQKELDTRPFPLTLV